MVVVQDALGVGSTALRYKLRSVDYDANEVLSIGDGCPWQEVPADDRIELTVGARGVYLIELIQQFPGACP
jgi:hypothetical protein